jgi:hypothetical protein
MARIILMALLFLKIKLLEKKCLIKWEFKDAFQKYFLIKNASKKILKKKSALQNHLKTPKQASI